MYQVGDRIRVRWKTNTSQLPGRILEVSGKENLEYVVRLSPDNETLTITNDRIYGYWFQIGDRVCDHKLRSGIISSNMDGMCSVNWDEGGSSQHRAEDLSPKIEVGNCYWGQSNPGEISQNFQVIAIDEKKIYCVKFTENDRTSEILGNSQLFFAMDQIKNGDLAVFGVHIDQLEGKIDKNHAFNKFCGKIESITDNMAAIITTKQYYLPVSVLSESEYNVTVTDNYDYLVSECCKQKRFTWNMGNLVGQKGYVINEGITTKKVKFTYISYIPVYQLRTVVSKINDNDNLDDFMNSMFSPERVRALLRNIIN